MDARIRGMKKKLILKKFNVEESDLLGFGGESWVYRLDTTKILRVYKGDKSRLWYFEALEAFYRKMPTRLPFAIPRIYEIGEVGGALYSIENHIKGKELATVLPNLKPSEKKVALRNYLKAVEVLKSVNFDDREYGELLTEHPVTRRSWRQFLKEMVECAIANNGADLEHDVDNFREVAEAVMRRIEALPEPPKALVHGDYFPKNMLVNEAFEVTGVIDFSPMTVVGDPLMDVAGALIFLEVLEGYVQEDSRILQDIIRQRYSTGVDETLGLYRLYYSFYLSGAKQDNPKLYKWCVTNLRA